MKELALQGLKEHYERKLHDEMQALVESPRPQCQS